MSAKWNQRLSDAGSSWLILFFLAWATGCSQPAPEEEPVGNGSFETPPVNVSVVALDRSELTETVVLTGRIEPWLELAVSSELGGTVLEINFDKGQRVKKDQVLARVGTDLLTLSLNEAEAALVEAEANYTKTKELFARQAVPRQELIAFTSRYEAAKARVALAKLRVERSIIDAPASGVAITREIDLGEVVPPGALITTIHQTNRLKVNVGIPENEISYFGRGGEASMTVDAYPDRKFSGKIHFLGPAASSKNRTFPAEVAVDNAEEALRPGMIARVSLVKRHFHDALVVPRDALLERDQGSVAFVDVEGRAQERQIVVGPSEGNRVVIEEGLTEGESLIVSGHRNLVDGQSVRVVNQD
jgi:membrane fusion protein (multidrug efflux system)